MIEIGLTKGMVAKVDECDADVAEYSWYYSGHGYAERKDSGCKKLYMHGVVLERILGRFLSEGEHCDHINGDPLDNRRENLRVCMWYENACNKRVRRDSSTGYKGVQPGRGGRFCAKVEFRNVRYHVGTFDTAEDAARARDAKARELHGEFARLNFSEQS